MVDAERSLMFGTTAPAMVAPPAASSRMRGWTSSEMWSGSTTTGVNVRLTPVCRYSVATTPRSLMVGTGTSSPEKNSAGAPLTVVSVGRAWTTPRPFWAQGSRETR